MKQKIRLVLRSYWFWPLVTFTLATLISLTRIINNAAHFNHPLNMGFMYFWLPLFFYSIILSLLILPVIWCFRNTKPKIVKNKVLQVIRSYSFLPSLPIVLSLFFVVYDQENYSRPALVLTAVFFGIFLLCCIIILRKNILFGLLVLLMGSFILFKAFFGIYEIFGITLCDPNKNTWTSVGWSSLGNCYEKYSDSGKSCIQDSDCQGSCIFTDEKTTTKDGYIVGSCSPDAASHDWHFNTKFPTKELGPEFVD